MPIPGQATSVRAEPQESRSPVALAVQGAGGGGWEYALWQAAFQARGWQFHAPDLLPRVPLEATTYADYLVQVQSWVQRWRPHLLIGASLGGLLALDAAVELPASSQLLLINPLPPAPLHTQLPAREWPARVDWAHRHDLAATRRAMPLADPASALYAQTRWRDESGAVLQHAWAGRGVAPVQAAVTLITGLLDTDIPPALQQTLAVQLGARHLELADAGHLDPLLSPAVVRQVISALHPFGEN